MIKNGRVRNFISNISFCFKLLYTANKKVFVLLALINLTMTIAPMILLFISRDIINSIVSGISGTGGSYTNVLLLIAFYFIMNIAVSFFTDYSAKISMLATQDLIKHINIRIMDKSTSMDISYFDIPQLFDEVNISRNNAKELHTMVFSLVDVLASIVQLIASLTIAISINPWFVLLVIAALLPKYLFSKKMELAAYSFDKAQSNDNRKLNYYYSLFFRKDSAREMRYYNFIPFILDNYLSLQKKVVFARNRFNNKNGLCKLLLTVPAIIVQIIISVFTIIKIARKVLTVGDYTLITGIYSALNGSIDSVMSSFAMFEGYNQKISDFKKYFAYDDGASLGQKEIGKINEIEFRNVSFTYPKSSEPTLKNVSFTLHKGEKIMLVGKNGAGKTTIVKLICGFYSEYEGEILINGVDLRKYNIVKLRSQMASVFQDFTIYSLTIRENVAFGDIANIGDDGLILKCLNNSSFCHESFTDGNIELYVNKEFDENGIVLSGGQQQKLAIARAYMRNPQLVLMDEPNAALDPIAERELLEQFKELYADCMLLFISHRLSNSAGMDRILVMENGTITEQGTHKDLMQQKGEYYRMFSLQSEKYNLSK